MLVNGAGTAQTPQLGSQPRLWAHLRGWDWKRRHITFLAGAGAIHRGAGATIVTGTDGRAVGAVGPCGTWNCTHLSLKEEEVNCGELSQARGLW